MTNCSGIYRIKNLKTNKIYIGSSKNLHKRKIQHLYGLRNNCHGNNKLQNSWNKYGEESFVFEVIEECEVEKLIEREQHWVDELNPHFNIRIECVATRLGVKRSKQTVKKLQPYRDLEKRKIYQINRTTAEIIKEWSSITECGNSLNITLSNIVACCKRKGYNQRQSSYTFRYVEDYNKEQVLKDLSYKKVVRKRKIPVTQLTMKGDFVREWSGIEEAGESLGVYPSAIHNCIFGRSKSCQKYKWKYSINN